MARDTALTGNDGADVLSIPNVVVVDPNFGHYKPLAASARLGKIDLHFRASGAEALKLATRRRVDAWLVATELDDMAGEDFVELLRSKLVETSVSPFASSARVAMVGHKDAAGRVRVQEAIEAGADSVVTQPITFRDLEDLLGVASPKPAAAQRGPRRKQAVVTLPVGVGAVIVAIAVLIMS